VSETDDYLTKKSIFSSKCKRTKEDEANKIYIAVLTGFYDVFFDVDKIEKSLNSEKERLGEEYFCEIIDFLKNDDIESLKKMMDEVSRKIIFLKEIFGNGEK